MRSARLRLPCPRARARSLLKALSTYDGRVHRACALTFGALAACLSWPVALHAEEVPAHWQGVRLAPLLAPLTCVLSGQVREQQTGACACIVEIAAAAPTALLNDALPALVSKIVALLRTKQTIVTAPLLNALRALSGVSGALFAPYAQRCVADALSLAKERHLLTETDDWHVKKAAIELLGALACDFPTLVPSAPPKERSSADGAAAAAVDADAHGGAPTPPRTTPTHQRGAQPVTRDAVYRLLAKLRTDPAKPVREAVFDVLEGMRAHCPLEPRADGGGHSPVSSACSSRRASGTPTSLRKIKEAAAAVAAAAKENAPDGLLIISPGTRPPRSLFAVSGATVPDVADLLPHAPDEPGKDARTLGERNAPREPDAGVKADGGAKADVALIVLSAASAAQAHDAAAAEPPMPAEALATLALEGFYGADEARSTAAASTPANEGSPGAIVLQLARHAFVPSKTLLRTPLAEPSDVARERAEGDADADAWKRMLSPTFEPTSAAAPRSLAGELGSSPFDATAGTVDARSAPALEPVAAAAQRTPSKCRAMSLALCLVLVGAAVFCVQPLVRPEQPIFDQPFGGVDCVEPAELGGVLGQLNAPHGAAMPSPMPSVVSEPLEPVEVPPPAFGMPDGAGADMVSGVAICSKTGEQTCDIVGWTDPLVAQPDAPGAGKLATDRVPCASVTFMVTVAACLSAFVISLLRRSSSKIKDSGGSDDLGSYVGYDDKLRSPVRAASPACSIRIASISTLLWPRARSPCCALHHCAAQVRRSRRLSSVHSKTPVTSPAICVPTSARKLRMSGLVTAL